MNFVLLLLTTSTWLCLALPVAFTQPGARLLAEPLLTGWRDDVVAADAVRVHGGLLHDGDFGLPAEPHDAVLGHHRHQSALGVLRKRRKRIDS